MACRQVQHKEGSVFIFQIKAPFFGTFIQWVVPKAVGERFQEFAPFYKRCRACLTEVCPFLYLGLELMDVIKNNRQVTEKKILEIKLINGKRIWKEISVW